VLGLSRRSRGGAYLDAHSCLQRVLAYVRGLEQGVAYDREEASAIFDRAWAESGLDGHPFGAGYRRLTQTMLDRLHETADGAASGKGQLSTKIGGESVTVEVDRVFQDGAVSIVRNIRSGRQGSGDSDRLSATMLLKAVQETFGAQARIENHYLLSGGVLEISQTKAKFDKRMSDCAAALGSIRQGDYPPNQDDFRCPRCPHLFICAAPVAGLTEA
jgi:hypothetical protein